MKRKRKRKRKRDEEEEERDGPLAILWDIENCCLPSALSPEMVADNTRQYLRRHGIKSPITLFSAYADFTHRRESCQWSGVHLIHVPNRRKDAADKAILLDMLLFAMDNPPPSSILLISGDVDFAPALHKLAQRGHSILVAATNLCQTSFALLSAAKYVWEWPQMASNADSPNQIQTQSLPNGNYSETIRESNPTLAMQVSSKRPKNCELFAETTSKPSPASLIQDSKLKLSGIDVVKEEILSLIHRMGGSINFSKIPILYQRTFKKTLDINRYGCKLKTLLEKIGDDIHVDGRGNTAWVYLISKGNCLCPQSNMNSDAPNDMNVTEAGHGLPSETETESNGTHMMQPSKIDVGDSGLPSQITTNPYPISLEQRCNICGLPYETSVQPTANRPSDLHVVKKELSILLSKNKNGLRSSQIAIRYKQTFNKELCVKNYGCKLKTLLHGIAYLQGKYKRRIAFFRPQESTN